MSFFLFKWAGAIGHLFADLFKSAGKAYDKLSDAEKEALQQGTGLIAVVNNNLDKAPAEIRALIQEKFPELSEPKLEAAFFAIIDHFHLFSAESLEEAIGYVQGHLKKLQGKPWEVASHAAAAVVSVLFAPPATKVAAIVSLLEYVYQTFFKK